MKKIINGKLYNTDTAKEVDYFRTGDGFSLKEETLYKKKTGEFFIVCEGGPMTEYGNGEGGFGKGIKPLTLDEAKKWVEECSDADTYIELFGEVEE